MSKKVMALAVFISLLAGGTGAIMLAGENTYFCEDTQQICIGTRLSSTGKTCYYMDDTEERGKRCLVEPYWQPYDNEPIEPVIIPYSTEQTGQQWSCSKDGCVPL